MAKERIIEIDLLRSIAIILMVIYHAAFDMRIHQNTWTWEATRIITVSLFLFLSGASLQFSSKPLRRAGIVLLCACIISIVTYLYDPNYFIYFGILHCIGLGMILLTPLRSLKEWNIPLGILVLLCSPDSAPPRATLDYYPLVPWIGMMMIGSGISYFLYKRHHVRFIQSPVPLIGAPGRHALLIYMVHQPILLIILGLLNTF